MIDNAAIYMSQGERLALAYAEGINSNMSNSHFHDFYELYYLISGERFHMIEGEIYHMKANSFVLFPPHTMHHSYGDRDIPFKRIVLYFKADLFSSPELDLLLCDKVRIFSFGNTKFSSVYQLLESIDEELKSSETFHFEYASSLLNQLMFTILRINFPPVENHQQNLITKAVAYIHEHYAEEIKISDLADFLYVSPYYLCRKFKETTGQTIIQYLNITRILRAERLLLETRNSITQISKEVGFSNLTHFNRMFKRITGCSPREKKKEYLTLQNTNKDNKK